MAERGTKKNAKILREFAWLIVTIMIVMTLATAWYTYSQARDDLARQSSVVSQRLKQSVESAMQAYHVILRQTNEHLRLIEALKNPQRAQQYLANIRASADEIAAIALTDTSGQMRASSERTQNLPNLKDFDERSFESFQQVVASKTFAVGRPYYLPTTEEWIIPVREPMLGDNGQVVAVLGAGIRLDNQSIPWADSGLPAGFAIALVRDDGYLNYYFPIPHENRQAALKRMYGEPVSEHLRQLAEKPAELYEHQRQLEVGTYTDHFVYVNRIPDYAMTAVVTFPEQILWQHWTDKLVLPLVFLSLSLLLLVGIYWRARNSLLVSNTHTERAQQKLKGALAQYDELTRVIPVGVYQAYVNRDGSIEMFYVSERMASLFAAEPEAIVDDINTLNDCLHEDDIPDFYRAQEFALKNRQPFNWQGRFVINGQLRWFSIQSQSSEADEQGRRILNGVVTDITERMETEQHIQHLAFYDSLTELPNRQLIVERLQHQQKVARRRRNYGAIVMIDFDDFHAVNDTFGHQSGDELLLQAAQRLQGIMRSHDTVARIASDEFAVIATDLDQNVDKAAEQCERIAEKICEALEQPYELSGKRHQLTISVGITLFGDTEQDPELYVQQASNALAMVKAEGKNGIRFFDSSMQAHVLERVNLDQALRDTQHGEQLQLLYQPQVNSHGDIIGHEALLRWQHPERGMVSPAEFIPLAEQSGAIVAMGRWVIQQGVAQLNQWQTDPDKCDWTLSLNISPRQFRDDSFVPTVRQALNELKGDPEHLIFELTESMLLDERDEIREKLLQIKRMGVKLSLDDFGTGYSSLSYLYQLPLDELKIDRAFVASITQLKSQRSLTQTIISMARQLELKVVAEGVETPEQFEILQQQGCGIFQGFLFGRPTATACEEIAQSVSALCD